MATNVSSPARQRAGSNKKGVTSDVKKTFRGLRQLFYICSDICVRRGDNVSARAWVYVANILTDVERRGPERLMEKIAEAEVIREHLPEVENPYTPKK